MAVKISAIMYQRFSKRRHRDHNMEVPPIDSSPSLPPPYEDVEKYASILIPVQQDEVSQLEQCPSYSEVAAHHEQSEETQ